MNNKIIWLTGQPGAGKTVLSLKLIEFLKSNYNQPVYHIDGDNLRELFKNVNYGKEGRIENIKRAQDIAKYVHAQGSYVVVSLVSPYKDMRDNFKNEMSGDLIEVYIHTTDIRGREHFHTDEYEKPTENYIDVDTTNVEPDVSLKTIINGLGWTKTNHGGEPTSNEDKKYAIFIGRFQPPHHGHFELFEQKLKEGIPSLIMIRDIIPDEKNPFTSEQTASMIEKYYESKNKDVKVMIIPDIESVNYGRGVGYEINEFTPPENIGFISATKIRESINNNDNEWKKMIDESIQDDIINYLKIK